MMKLSDIVPEKEYDEMPDRVWETYYALVGICNSLNAISGTKTFRPQRDLLLRAQGMITALLEETGRLKEYNDWDKSRCI